MPTPDHTRKERWGELHTLAERNGANILTDAGRAPLQEVMRAAAADPISVSASTATVQASWHGRMVRLAQGCTVTIPADLPLYFSCGWQQQGTGPIEFVEGDGATIQSLGDAVESAGQYAIGGLAVLEVGKATLYGALA